MSGGLRGYVGDEPFILAYEDEQSPATIAYRAQSGGAPAPDPFGSFTYCDIGCGRALTITILAAANPQSEFIGIDPNPDHISEARERADAAGLTNIRFIENYIGKMGEGDLPPLDFATANGLYSCIEEQERANLRRQAATYLKPGGLFQFSYNMAAGCTQMEPLRRMMKRMERLGEGSPAERRARAMRTISQMAAADHPFFRSNPRARTIVEDWPRRDQALMIHTYFHSAWGLHDPGEVIDLCAEEGLGFCGPWDLHLLPPSERERFAPDTGDDLILKEALAATMRAETYRTDVFRKGAAMTGREAIAMDEGAIFGLAGPETWLGDPVERKADPIAVHVYRAGPTIFSDLVDKFGEGDSDTQHVAARLGRLIREGWVRRYRSAPEPIETGGEYEFSTVLGQHIAEDIKLAANGAYIPAPLLGGGVFVNALMLALLSVAGGPKQAWSKRALDRIESINKEVGRPTGDRNVMAKRIDDGLRRLHANWAPFLISVGAIRGV